MTKIKSAVRDLDRELLTVEAEGDYAKAKEMLDTLGVLRPVLKRAFERLEGIPTDIEPIFYTAEELVPTARNQPLTPVKSPRKKPRHR
jgi:hypothetical protein